MHQTHSNNALDLVFGLPRNALHQRWKTGDDFAVMFIIVNLTKRARAKAGKRAAFKR